MTANCLIFCLVGAFGADWPSWRGPAHDGIGAGSGYPANWPAEAVISWKLPLAGAGNSSPVIAGGLVFVTASSGADHSRLHALAVDAASGAIRWRRDFWGTQAPAPFSMFPPQRGHAASSPAVSDGKLVCFYGTGDIACLDCATGEPLWFRALAKEHGPITNDYGIASSPLVENGRVLVQVDHLEGSYLKAFDLTTGKPAWRTERRGTYDNWSTPVPVTRGGVREIVCLGTRFATGYDPASGKESWRWEGLERLCAPTPVYRDGMLYAVSGPGGRNIALNLRASGPVVPVWQSAPNGPFIPSAIVVGNHYFAFDDQGIGSCLELSTGAVVGRARLNMGRLRPSPVSVEGRIYVISLDGKVAVLKADPSMELISKGDLGEEVAASPALFDGSIFVRGSGNLMRIRKGK